MVCWGGGGGSGRLSRSLTPAVIYFKIRDGTV